MVPKPMGQSTTQKRQRLPGRTYRLDPEKKRISGFIDGQDAVRQSIYKILRTERYAYLIYSWNYGSELERFIGQDFDYVRAAIEGEIKESLYMDDRIKEVSDFQIKQVDQDACLISFFVETAHGELYFEEKIDIG